MAYRATEGKALYADVTSRVALILALYEQVEALESERVATVREKLQQGPGGACRQAQSGAL